MDSYIDEEERPLLDYELEAVITIKAKFKVATDNYILWKSEIGHEIEFQHGDEQEFLKTELQDYKIDLPCITDFKSDEVDVEIQNWERIPSTPKTKNQTL